MEDTKKSGLEERMADIFFEIEEPEETPKRPSPQTGTKPVQKEQK